LPFYSKVIRNTCKNVTILLELGIETIIECQEIGYLIEIRYLSLKMGIKLVYKITKDTYAAQYEYLQGSSLTKGTQQVIINFIAWVLLCSAALILSVEAKKPMYTFLFLIFLVLNSAKMIPVLRFRKYAISNYVKDFKEKDMVLYFDEEGLTEITSGIVSKAPWSSVVSYVFFKENLFIELTGSLWALVPTGSLNVDSHTVEEAVEYLQSKNIPDRNKME
jgi:hypothetical protein